MDQYNIISFIGIFVLMIIAWAISGNRKVVNYKLIVAGLLIQLAFGVFIFLIPIGSRFFLFLSDVTVKILGAATAGTSFCFGPLSIPPGEKGSLGFFLAFQALPTIIFFASLMGILYYVRVMPFLIKLFARLFARTMKVSGAESLCVASNIFVGIESTTTILPFLKKMTRSEVNTILTAGLATVASSVLGLYTMILHSVFPNIAGHLISASLLSAPAALMMSKLLLPETDQPETLGQQVEPYCERSSNIIESAIQGATAGGKLVMGVIILLIAFLGLVALCNLGLDGVSLLVEKWTGITLNLHLEHILAYVFYPFALIIGVPPADAMEVARLLGVRMIMTEIPAYQQLNQLIADGAFHYARSPVLASYALCGFAHIASIAIFVGGISALAPNQTKTLSEVAFRALIAATLACLMTAAIAGVFYGHGSVLFQ